MRGTDTSLVTQIIENINTSLGAYGIAGVQLTQVNMVLPDGRAMTLVRDAHAIDNGDGTFTADWVIETHA